MQDSNEPTMSDQGFIDRIGDKFRDIIGKLPTVPANPSNPTPPTSDMPPWLSKVLGWVLTIVLAFLAARYGISPAPLPSLQAQPQVLVMTLPQGASVEAVKK